MVDRFCGGRYVMRYVLLERQERCDSAYAARIGNQGSRKVPKPLDLELGGPLTNKNPYFVSALMGTRARNLFSAPSREQMQ